MPRKIKQNDGDQASRRESGATGGASLARGVDYQLDYAIYHSLALMTEQLGAPYLDLNITLEPRILHRQGVTRSDMRIASTSASAELKLHPSRDDILEWISRVAADPTSEKHELVFAVSTGTLLVSLAALLRLAKEAGEDTAQLNRLAEYESVKDREALLRPFDTAAASG